MKFGLFLDLFLKFVFDDQTHMQPTNFDNLSTLSLFRVVFSTCYGIDFLKKLYAISFWGAGTLHAMARLVGCIFIASDFQRNYAPKIMWNRKHHIWKISACPQSSFVTFFPWKSGCDVWLRTKISGDRLIDFCHSKVSCMSSIIYCSRIKLDN